MSSISTSTVDNIHPNSSTNGNDVEQSIKSFLDTIQKLAGCRDLRRFATIFDHNIELQQELKAKDLELSREKKRNEEIENERKLETERMKLNHEASYKQIIGVHHSNLTEAENKFKLLGQETDQLKNGLEIQSETIFSMKQELKNCEEQARKNKKEVETGKKKLADAVAALAQSKSDSKSLQEKLVKSQADLDQQASQVSELRQLATKTETDKRDLAEKLRGSKEKLAQFEMYTESLNNDDIPTTIGKIDDLWKSLYAVVKAYFDHNLPDAVLQNFKVWNDLRDKIEDLGEVPIPRSNAPPAKQMRTVIFVAAIARLFSEAVFCPTYTMRDNEDFCNMLVHTAVKDGQRERILRALLVSMPEYVNREPEKDREHEVFKAIRKLLEDLVVGDEGTKFYEELRTVLKTALQIWRRVQRSNIFLHASLDLNFGEEDNWDTFDLSPLSNKKKKSADPTRADDGRMVLVIFPGIYHAHDGAYEMVSPGSVLRQWQIALATDCLKKLEPNNSPVAARLSFGARFQRAVK